MYSVNLDFLKVSGTGNDFIVVMNFNNKYNHNWSNLARVICRRRFSVGADGLVVLGESKKADAQMRIFNPDGSEAEMCGNAARCSARALVKEGITSSSHVTLETLSGIIEAEINGNNVKIKMTKPENFRGDISVKIGNMDYKGSFINTGVPHAVFFTDDIEKIDLINIGPKIRYHKQFQPDGTNVDFVQILNDNSISIRTYERGVESETYACGTGAVAAGIVTHLKGLLPVNHIAGSETRKIIVLTKGGKLLVELEEMNGKIGNVYLESPVEMIYSAKYLGEKNV